MTSAPNDPPADGGNVVPLRAVDAQTEVRLDEDQGAAPAYVDLTRGDGQRRPLVPEHWRTRENAKRHLSLMAARHGHRAAYHGLRSPAYFTRALAFALWGVIVTGKRLIAWWHIPGTGRAGVQGRRGRPDPRPPAAPQAGPRDAPGPRHDPGAVPGRADRRHGRHGRVRAVVGVGAVRRGAVRGVRASPGARRARRSRRRRRCPRRCSRRPATSSSARSGSIGIARDQPGHRRRATFPPLPVARSARTAPAGASRSTCPTASRPRRSSSGASARLGPAPPARRGVARAGHPRARRAARAAGSAARTSPRSSPRRGRGCGPAAATCSARCRSAPTRAAAASTGTVIEHNWLLGSMPGQGKTSALRVLVGAARARPHRRDVDPRAEGHRRPRPVRVLLAPVHLAASTTSRSATRPSRWRSCAAR